MPTFKFRLESVLELRKRIEEQRKKELASLRELLRKEQDFLKELETKTVEALQGMKECQKGTIFNIEEVMRYYRYFTFCRDKIKEQISIIEGLIASVEKKREDLVAASKERKILEKLKENQLHEYKVMMDSWETKMIDELATNGYTHRKGVN